MKLYDLISLFEQDKPTYDEDSAIKVIDCDNMEEYRKDESTGELMLNGAYCDWSEEDLMQWEVFACELDASGLYVYVVEG